MRELRRKGFDENWSAQDDEMLKSLVDKYRMNWSLIAECFNSMRAPLPKSERRSRLECYNRWHKNWGREEMEQASSGGNGTSSSVPSRGVKRQSSLLSPTVGHSVNLDNRKRRRHVIIQDAIRKTAKKRELAAKAGTCLFILLHISGL